MALSKKEDIEESSYWRIVALNVHQGISYLWHEGFGTDFEIIAGGKSFRCHKIVIAAVSDYFNAMFNSGMQETKQDKVVFEDINSESFDTIFKILYPKEPVEKRKHPLEDKSETDIFELITLASRFQMEFLKTLSLDFLRTTLSCDNCVNRWKTGEEIQCEELALMGRDFVRSNFEELIPLRTLDSIQYADFLSIIGDNELVIKNEEVIWRAIHNWVNFNEKDRSPYIATLIKECCLTEIQTEFLMEEIAFDPLVRLDHEASRVVKEALRYKSHPSIHCNLELKLRECHEKEQVTVLLYEHRDDETLNNAFQLLRGKVVFRVDRPHVMNSMSSQSIVRLGRDFWNISCCVYGQSMFVLNGSIFDEPEFLQYSDEEWTSRKSIGISLLGHTMCASGKCLYVSGGKSGFQMNTHVWKYDIRKDSWTKGGEIISPVINASSVAYKRKIYIIGGTTELRESVDCVQIYDPLTETGAIFCHLQKPCSFSRAVLRRSTAYIVTSDGDVERISLESADTSVIATIGFKDKMAYGINMRSDELTIYCGSRSKNPTVASLDEENEFETDSEISLSEENDLNGVDDFIINVKTGAVRASRSVLHRRNVLGCVSLVINLCDF